MSRNQKLRTIDGQQVEQVNQFKCLGSVILTDGYYGTEIQHRIALMKQSFMNNKKLFTGSLSIELKKRILKSVLCSVVLYLIF